MDDCHGVARLVLLFIVVIFDICNAINCLAHIPLNYTNQPTTDRFGKDSSDCGVRRVAARRRHQRRVCRSHSQTVDSGREETRHHSQRAPPRVDQQRLRRTAHVSRSADETCCQSRCPRAQTGNVFVHVCLLVHNVLLCFRHRLWCVIQYAEKSQLFLKMK